MILLSLMSGFSVSALSDGFFGYRLLDDSTAEVVNIPGDSDVIIPKEVDGHTVSTISLSSFSVDYLDGLSDDNRDRVFSGEYGRVRSLTIPEGVKEIVVTGFEDLENLSSINVVENNPYFSSSDGILYSKDKTKLLYCPRGKEVSDFTVPEGVKEIGNNAFEHNNDSYRYSLTTVVLPEGLEKIGDYAFNGDYYLASVTIPDTVTEIGTGAFQRCSALEKIRLPKNLKAISKDLLHGCRLSGIEIPKSVKSIGSNAFTRAFYYGTATNITINIPEGVERIEEKAFEDSSLIRKITIPSSVTFFGQDALLNSGLNEINVDKNNKAYSSQDDVLYNKDKTELIYCSNLGFTFVVPMSVTKIDENAFANCRPNAIYISANVTEMDYCGLAKRAKDSQELNNEYNYVTIYGFKGSAAEKYFEEHSTYLVHYKTITKMPSEASGKKANPITVKTAAKSIKASALKKANKTVKPITVKSAKGAVKVVKVKSGTTAKIYKKITVNAKTGAITFKKGSYAKKTYSIKLKTTAAGNSDYNSKTVTKTVKVKVK